MDGNGNGTRADELERLERIAQLLRNLLAEVGKMKTQITACERMDMRNVTMTPAHSVNAQARDVARVPLAE